jgi:hypothetical protein
MRIFIACIICQIEWSSQGDEIDRECSMHKREEEWVYDFCGMTVRKRPLGRLKTYVEG